MRKRGGPAPPSVFRAASSDLALHAAAQTRRRKSLRLELLPEPVEGKGSGKEQGDGPAQHPLENTQEEGHPEKHEHGLAGRCQILPSPPLVSSKGANQMIQPHEWQCVSSRELVTS